MKNSGLAFHCNHDILFAFVYNFAGRVKYIKANKPEEQQELRLRLFQLVPDKLIPGRDSKEWADYKKAGVAYEETWTDPNKAWEAYGKTGIAYGEAWGQEIEALHEKLCPDCPWDGRTIFPDKN